MKERLLELIKKMPGEQWDHELVDYLIENGVTVQEWISVEDRLPSSEDLERSQFHNFLVANEFGEVREAVFTGKYFAKLGSRLSGVTHWMPLPEPPKESVT